MIFDPLTAKHKIEEIRLILGKKIELFLLEKLFLLKNFLNKILNHKSTAFFGSLFIIISSLLIQSNRDLGEISSARLLKYPAIIFDNFSNLQLLTFSLFFINLSGIISIFLSYKILKKSEIINNRALLNIIILSFTFGFFIRNNEFYSNEIVSESAIFLIFLYPILASFLSKNSHNPTFFITLILLAIPSSLGSSINFLTLKQNLFPIFLFLFLLKKEIQNNELLKKLFFIIILTSISAAINNDFTALQSIFLTQICLCFYFIYPKINFKKDWPFLIPILLILQFNSKDITLIALDLCCFWWVFVLFERNNFKNKNHIFLPNDFNSWIYFLILLTLTNALLFFPNLSQITWIICAIIFALMINFYNNLGDNKKFSRLFASTIFMVLSYIIHINFLPIFKHDDSLNYINQKINEYTINYAKNNEITLINLDQTIGNQALIYLNKKHSLIFDKNQNLNILKTQLQDQNNKLIFIFNDLKPCKINILEELLIDKTFKDLLSNYKFLNQVTEEKILEKEFDFFAQDNINETLKTNKTISKNVEIYIKN